MPSSTILALSAAALLGFSQFANAQTNITSHACASGSEYNSCNRKVADDWSSCIRDCNGNGDCIVDCGCTSHQNYINCMAQTCWNQVPPLIPSNPSTTTTTTTTTTVSSPGSASCIRQCQTWCFGNNSTLLGPKGTQVIMPTAF